MKSYMKKIFVIILLAGLISCSKDALRQNDLLQQKFVQEKMLAQKEKENELAARVDDPLEGV